MILWVYVEFVRIPLCVSSRFTPPLMHPKGFWDGKERKSIEMFNIQNTFDKKKVLVKSYSQNKSFMNSFSSPWNKGTSLWVSSMTTNGNWVAVCGGAENSSNSTRSSPNGFMSLWHLPSRTFTSGCVTRESLNDITYNPALGCFVSGGNEGRISFWDASKLSLEGRSWSTVAMYTTSVYPGSEAIMVTGGAGGILDCFVDRVRVSQLKL